MALDVLSKRESEVMAYMIMGTSPDQICKTLCVTKQTIKNHLMNTYKKLKVKNNVQLISGWFLKTHDLNMVQFVQCI
jgi:DNA-binding CsgD family transcriptional regulator